MHAFQKHFNLGNGVDNFHAMGSLKIWLEEVFGGYWTVGISKYGYHAGVASELYAVMVEDTLIVVYRTLPASMKVFNDGAVEPKW